MSHDENIHRPKDGGEDSGNDEYYQGDDEDQGYCEVCNVELNSLQAAYRHADGAEHQEKAQGFKEALKSGVVPADRRYGKQEVQRKGLENIFYCGVCIVELNSVETMMSHASGAKHQEKMLALEAKRMENLHLG